MGRRRGRREGSRRVEGSILVVGIGVIRALRDFGGRGEDGELDGCWSSMSWR